MATMNNTLRLLWVSSLLAGALLAQEAKKPSASKTETETEKPKEEMKPETKPEVVIKPAEVSTMLETELKDFEAQPEGVKRIIRAALALTKLKLTYRYASHEVAQGGMDCSGAVYRVLLDEKVSGVPRQSDEMCGWTQTKGTFHRTEKVTKLEDAAFEHLRPGDLLFWSRQGGVEPGRKIPVTHVMIFLGHRVKDGKPVIYGSSDGRSYEGQRRCGVSVFNFTLPKADDPKVEFYGYGAVPGLVKEEVRKAEAAKEP
jgi:cell wall-associated NlpC family hydrolase